MPTVIIADDHDIIRQAIATLLRELNGSATLQAELELVAEASNGLEAIALVKSHKPDLLFLDISMPHANGVEVIHDIHRWSPETKIAVFTGVMSSGLIAGAVQAGVQALFSKGAATKLLAEKLPLILAGGRYIAPEFLQLLEDNQQIATLTEREHQILNMIITGKSNKEIADILCISAKTVDKHRTSMMNKLDVHSVAELMARALRDGLIDSF